MPFEVTLSTWGFISCDFSQQVVFISVRFHVYFRQYFVAVAVCFHDYFLQQVVFILV